MSEQQEIIDRIEKDLAELKRRAKTKPVTLEDVMERLDALQREIASIPRFQFYPVPCTRPHYPPLYPFTWSTTTQPATVVYDVTCQDANLTPLISPTHAQGARP